MKKKFLSLTIIFIFFIIISCFSLPQVMRSELARVFWDPVWCYPRISKTAGIEPTYSDIKFYIISLMHEGMSHDETISILEKFGSVEEKPYFENHRYKKISINLCSSSDSYILIMVKFSESGKLLEVIDVFDY